MIGEGGYVVIIVLKIKVAYNDYIYLYT